MIEIPRTSLTPGSPLSIKIIGLGGAGSNALDRIALDGVPGAELIAVNTDVQSLTGSVAPQKLQLGQTTTRGLGAGGDPEVGYAAADEGADDLRSTLEGANLVFICVGLGGGTGSGAAPIVASIAREQHALVVVFATMPFSFEGRRRLAQADEALTALQHLADVVICFENDTMADAVSPRAGIQDAFAAADQTISQSVRAIAALAQRRGVIQLGFDELATALRAQNARCLFGCGEAAGDTRAHTALERALRSPLMDKGRMLEDAENLLVSVAGGAEMTLNEVQILMEELNRHVSDSTRILFGVAVDPALGDRMSVTLVSSVSAGVRAEMVPLSAPPRVETASPRAAEPEVEESQTGHPEPTIAFVESDEALETRPAVSGPQRRPISSDAPLASDRSATNNLRRLQGSAASVESAREKTRQEQMQFEPVTRGRFEKVEPTIIDGQDLDVPTFLRRNLRLK